MVDLELLDLGLSMKSRDKLFQSPGAAAHFPLETTIQSFTIQI